AVCNTASAPVIASSSRPRSLLLNRGAQVPDQRQKARSDVALEQIGPELESGPTAPDDDWFRSVARIERGGDGVDVAAPFSEREAIAVLLVVAERLFETLPRQRPILRAPRADLLEDGLALFLRQRADIGAAQRCGGDGHPRADVDDEGAGVPVRIDHLHVHAVVDGEVDRG